MAYECNNLFVSSQVVRILVLLTLIGSCIVQVSCLNFSFPSFRPEDRDVLNFSANSYIALGALQVIPDVNGVASNTSGRVLYGQPFRLSTGQLKTSFVSSFVFNIQPQTSPTGEGLAFILTESPPLPENSGGQWIGIINSSTTGSSNIVAVEFDTRKSFPEDLDDNHVGVDVRSTVSIAQASLNDKGLNLSGGYDIRATVHYDAQLATVDVLVYRGQPRAEYPVLSQPLDLYQVFRGDIYVGFSASTGVNATQLNCIKYWNFISYENSVQIPDKTSFNRLWIWLMVSVTVSLLISVILFIRYKNRRQKRRLMEADDAEVELKILNSSTAPQKFRLKELRFATENFNSMNKLGKGGFGTVYKGMLGNFVVAVKRISKNSSDGKKDFIAEVTSIGNLHHKNLVKLIGWCYESNELLLVYEFMPNGSLDKFIFCNETAGSEDDKTLTWGRRHNIIIGVAQALDYLHNGCQNRVLHRDIKASNILMDLEFNARLGDFGLARVILLNENTHHSTKEIAGTPGYMAPESFHTGRATVETDVYAFGILMLEIVCGRRPGHRCEANGYCDSIVDRVWESYRTDRLASIVDSRINEDADMDQIKNVLMLALSCCHPNPYERPPMNAALQVLSGEAEPPEVAVKKPAFMWPCFGPLREVGCSLSGAQFTASAVLSGR